MDDLSKHRRFALAIGIVLIVYSLAAVELDVGEAIKVFGFSFKIQRPKWILGGLMLASMYALYRYWLHALFLAESPMRSRAEIKKSARKRCEALLNTARVELASNRARLVKEDVSLLEERVATREEELSSFWQREIISVVSEPEVWEPPGFAGHFQPCSAQARSGFGMKRGRSTVSLSRRLHGIWPPRSTLITCSQSLRTSGGSVLVCGGYAIRSSSWRRRCRRHIR